jgi:hypothetical protein
MQNGLVQKSQLGLERAASIFTLDEMSTSKIEEATC